MISGWACDTNQIEIEFNNDSANRWRAGTGTLRTDTQGVCGDSDNGFGLLFNWNRLGDGAHTVTAYADGVEFAQVTVTVTTLGEEFRRGLSHVVGLPDFPTVGTDVVLQWQEAQQNFVIIHELPTQRLVEVTPTVTFPAGVQIPNLAVTSLYAETATVRASPEPTLLLAEDADNIVLLGLANMDGGLLGDRPGEAEVSVASTVVTLVGMVAGRPVSAMTSEVVDAITTHPHYPAITTALSAGLASDPHFLASIGDDAELVRLIEEVAAALPRVAPPQGVFAENAQSRPAPSAAPPPLGTVRPAVVSEDPAQRIPELLEDCARDLEEDSPERDRLRERLAEAGISLANLFLPVESTNSLIKAWATTPTLRAAVKSCTNTRTNIAIRAFESQNTRGVRLASGLSPTELMRESLNYDSLRRAAYLECQEEIAPDGIPSRIGAVLRVGLEYVNKAELLARIPRIGKLLKRWYGDWEKAERRETARAASREALAAVEEYCKPDEAYCILKFEYQLYRGEAPDLAEQGILSTDEILRGWPLHSARVRSCVSASENTLCRGPQHNECPAGPLTLGITRQAYPAGCEGARQFWSDCEEQIFHNMGANRADCFGSDWVWIENFDLGFGPSDDKPVLVYGAREVRSCPLELPEILLPHWYRYHQ